MRGNIYNIIIVSLIIAFWVLLIVRVVKNKCAPIKTVKAVVIDKHKIESFSKYSGNGKRENCVVVFCAEGKKLSFYVSEFSYVGYKINEKGTLKYRGDRIIGFN